MRQCGDYVWVVFWRRTPAVYPGQPDGGAWDVVSGRVMSAGEVVCYALDNPGLPGHVGGNPHEEVAQGTPYRFVDARRVFQDQESAEAAAKSLPPPK